LSKSNRVKFTLHHAKSYEEAVNIINTIKFDVYLIDYGLGIKNGLELLNEVRPIIQNKAVIFFTGQKNNDIDIKALECGATDYIIKGDINEKALERSILYAVERKKLERTIIEKDRLNELIFETTNSGICIVDRTTKKILKVNNSFCQIFKIKKENVVGKDFEKTIKIKSYEKALYNKRFCTNHYYSNNRILEQQDDEANVEVSSGANIDCLVFCKDVTFQNGKETWLRLITFVDISKQKETERKLMETQEEMIKMVEEYGLKTQEKKPMLDLVNIELQKFKDSSKMLSFFNNGGNLL
jgi:PAS domain S-box-containing protein